MNEKIVPFLLLLALIGGVIAYRTYGNKSKVGEACERSSECKKGLVCGHEQLGRLCTAPCASSTDCDELGSNLMCLGDIKHCTKRCTRHGDCPETHACINGACRIGGKMPNY